jgi:hypothetical protein
MNDFSELENELQKLRPLPPSPELFAKIEQGIIDGASKTNGEQNIVRVDRFQINWRSLGLGLAAAAVLLLLARVGFQSSQKESTKAASASPAPSIESTTTDSAGVEPPVREPERLANRRATPSTQRSIRNEFMPAGTTQVVYRTRDEGLLFPAGSEQPMRRLRSQMHETLQWRNPGTGASLRVSYPSEEIELVPISGQ